MYARIAAIVFTDICILTHHSFISTDNYDTHLLYLPFCYLSYTEISYSNSLLALEQVYSLKLNSVSHLSK